MVSIVISYKNEPSKTEQSKIRSKKETSVVHICLSSNIVLDMQFTHYASYRHYAFIDINISRVCLFIIIASIYIIYLDKMTSAY